MLHDVEDILDSWENTGLLQDCPDRFNFALCLDTQRRVNETLDCTTQFRRVSIPAILNVCKQRPDIFQGLVDANDCNDVYKLGVMPKGEDADVCTELVLRILQLNLSGQYFGGIVYQDGRIYLRTGED